MSRAISTDRVSVACLPQKIQPRSVGRLVDQTLLHLAATSETGGFLPPCCHIESASQVTDAIALILFIKCCVLAHASVIH